MLRLKFRKKRKAIVQVSLFDQSGKLLAKKPLDGIPERWEFFNDNRSLLIITNKKLLVLRSDNGAMEREISMRDVYKKAGIHYQADKYIQTVAVVPSKIGSSIYLLLSEPTGSDVEENLILVNISGGSAREFGAIKIAESSMFPIMAHSIPEGVMIIKEKEMIKFGY